MKIPKRVNFSLRVRKDTSLEDAITALELIANEVKILERDKEYKLVDCEAPTNIYEMLSGTRLVEKTCTYTDMGLRKKVMHRYITVSPERTKVVNSLENYFESISTFGWHAHRYRASR